MICIKAKIPEGYEAVRIDTYVGNDEFYLGPNGDVLDYKAYGLWMDLHPVLIIRKKKLWRAELGEKYEYVNELGRVRLTEESGSTQDNARHEYGNYYIPGTGYAGIAAEKVREAHKS